MTRSKASNAPQAAALPARIGSRYDVLELLGRGGTAVVYRVRDEARNSDVALKQLTPIADPEKRRKVNALFEREFYVLAQLSHPSIVQAYDFGIDPAGPFFTMELLEGGVVDDRTPLAYRSCCEVGVQVCSALSLIHSRRFIHRDLSPRNIHWTKAGHAKLIDFGALMPMGTSRQIVGTPPFTSPEAIHGLGLDARSDLFSLGATLYFMLTGRTPFVARTFEELADAWRYAPTPPSEIVPGIPAELDALVLALLRIDAAHRPRSAFEVMQRLAAIAGISVDEGAEVSRAYLSTPTLVGRDAELHKFDVAARRVMQSRGGALAIEGAAGSGRSRLLDAWVLEARTLGLAISRAAGNAAARPFTAAYELAAQLTEALREPSIEAAKREGLFELLFEVTDERPRLKSLASLSEARDRLSEAFATFIEALSRDRALVIAVDDVERIDEASLAILAALASRKAERRLLVAVTMSTDIPVATRAAVDVLANQCERIKLRALAPDQIETLFSSVFGTVPSIAIVSDRISAIGLGNPGASMAVAQHMVDEGLIRFAGGHWQLPAELTLTDLPADAKQVLRRRVENLPPLARRLAELQALAFEGKFDRADYAELAGAENAAHVDAAIDALVQRGVLTSAGDAFVLTYSDRALLVSGIPAERARAHHAVLAAYFAAKGAPLADVHHWVIAGEGERALDRIVTLVALYDDQADLHLEINGLDVAATLEEALRAGRALQRRPRELHDIARSLVTLSIIADNKLHARHAQYTYERLEIDSGLSDYHKLDPSLPAAERLKLALEAAVARYAATPEHERVYRVDEAIRFLARHVSIQIAIGSRTRNAELLYTNSLILAPLAPLTPLLAALSENAIAAYEMNVLGRSERARERVTRVYDQLSKVQGTEEQYARLIRSAVAAGLAFIESSLGLPSIWHWIATIESDRLQVVNAFYLRRVLCIVEGDNAGAEVYRTRAEVTSLQSNVRQMFMPPLRHELTVQVRAGDLSGVKQVADQIARIAEGEPGWLPQHHIAQGYYQRIRGDLAAAQVAFEHAIESSQSGRPESTDFYSWASGVAGLVGTLVDRGRAEEARTLGRDALAKFEALGMCAATWDLVRELAFAESKLGEHVAAAERLDALIASREGSLPSHRVVDYEARVRIALEAKDHDAAAQYLAVLAQHGRSVAGYLAQPRLVQLSDEARRAGVQVELPDTSSHYTFIAPRNQARRQAIRTRVAEALAQADAPARAKNGLALLLEAVGGESSGQLYLEHEAGLYLAASQDIPPDLALEEMARRHWQQLGDSEGVTELRTQTHSAELPGTQLCIGPDGTNYLPLVLRVMEPDGPRRVGLAFLAANDSQPLAADVREIASVLSTKFVELGDARALSMTTDRDD